MFCHKCGEKIADGAAFCHKCGAKVICENHDFGMRDESHTTEKNHKIKTKMTVPQILGNICIIVGGIVIFSTIFLFDISHSGTIITAEQHSEKLQQLYMMLPISILGDAFVLCGLLLLYIFRPKKK